MSLFDNTFPFSRRQMLAQTSYGVGTIGLAAVLASDARAAEPVRPLAARPPHFPAKAKRIIHLWMNGGPSQVDTFDPKPTCMARSFAI